MKCFQCKKGPIVDTTVDVPGSVRGEQLTVRTEATVCQSCGFQVLSKDQAGAYGVAIADAYRKKHGLLTAANLKTIRQTLSLSQRDFARFLKVGVASVKRWEAGLIQDEAMDQLIRLKTDLDSARSNVEQLERRLGIEPKYQRSEFIEVQLFGRVRTGWNAEPLHQTPAAAPWLGIQCEAA